MRAQSSLTCVRRGPAGWAGVLEDQYPGLAECQAPPGISGAAGAGTEQKRQWWESGEQGHHQASEAAGKLQPWGADIWWLSPAPASDEDQEGPKGPRGSTGNASPRQNLGSTPSSHPSPTPTSGSSEDNLATGPAVGSWLSTVMLATEGASEIRLFV